MVVMVSPLIHLRSASFAARASLSFWNFQVPTTAKVQVWPPVFQALGTTPIRPEIPKRPANAYSLFMKDAYPQIKLRNPTLKLSEISKLVAIQWKEVSDNEKQQWKDKSEALMTSYKQALANMTPEETDLMNKAKESRKEILMKKKRKNHRNYVYETLGYPRPPKSSVAFFISENFKKDPNKSVSEVFTGLVSTWKTLPLSEKKPYNDKAAAASAEHKLSVENWRKKMAQIGLEMVKLAPPSKKPKKATRKVKAKPLKKKVKSKTRKRVLTKGKKGKKLATRKGKVVTGTRIGAKKAVKPQV